jgi:methylglutaconyl-CoA hydratase
MKYKTILIEKLDSTATVYLNRPEIHNAFNEVVIAELTLAFKKLGNDDSVRVIILTGKGKSFCAGADLNWMRKMKDYSYEENYADAYKLHDMMYAVYSCPKPVIAMVNGSAFGGGNGLLSACDIAVASTEALFSLSEVKLGLAPAVISPYIMKKIGEGYAREFMLTGERIDALTAYRIGLVNRIAEPENLQAEVDKIVRRMINAGPNALKMCKEMIHHIAEMDEKEVGDYNANLIAKLRMSEEGQEGIAAFFEKRKPSWLNDKS